MKDKDYNQVLKETLDNALESLSKHMIAKGQEVAFFLHENECLIEYTNETKTVSYAIVLEAQKVGKTKKLYFRKYDLTNRSLNSIKRQAYWELIDVTIGTFLLTAVVADDETLMKLSTKRD